MQRGADRDRAIEPADQVAELISLSLMPEFRGGISQRERFVFSARFGEAAAATVEAEEDALDLQGFGNRYGDHESLLLLDTLFSIASATNYWA